MSDTLTNTTPTLRSNRLGKVDPRYIAWFSLLVLAGGVAALYPTFWLYCLAAVAALGICWGALAFLGRAELDFWQILALSMLSGYLILNYGFDNIAFHVGAFPVLIAYGSMWAALALAMLARRKWVSQAMREPALLCLLGLLVLAAFHLIRDIPAYGNLAIRDATMCLDGLFVIMGLLWARKKNSAQFLTKWLMVIFVINMFYSATLPWTESLWSWSPESGVFETVPILGNFRGSGDLLLAGAVFCICIGSYVIKRRAWLLTVLVLGQLLGIAITQVRRMYLGIVVVVLILIVAGEIKKFAKLFILVPASILVVFAVTSLGGLHIEGRVGEVNLDFFKDHLRSLSGAEDTPGSAVQSRFTMMADTYQHFVAHPILGEGFGLPVVNVVEAETGQVTRSPHNAVLTVLARLGAVGFVLWLSFHLCLWSRFFWGFRHRRSGDRLVYLMLLWLFMYYVLFMMGAMVEDSFVAPCGAVPFYFFMGYALGLARWQMSPKNNGEPQLAGLASSAQKTAV